MRKNTQEYLSKKVVGSVHHPHNTRAVGSRFMEPRHNLRLVADPRPSGCKIVVAKNAAGEVWLKGYREFFSTA